MHRVERFALDRVLWRHLLAITYHSCSLYVRRKLGNNWRLYADCEILLPRWQARINIKTKKCLLIVLILTNDVLKCFRWNAATEWQATVANDDRSAQQTPTRCTRCLWPLLLKWIGPMAIRKRVNHFTILYQHFSLVFSSLSALLTSSLPHFFLYSFLPRFLSSSFLPYVAYKADQKKNEGSVDW